MYELKFCAVSVEFISRSTGVSFSIFDRSFASNVGHFWNQSLALFVWEGIHLIFRGALISAFLSPLVPLSIEESGIHIRGVTHLRLFFFMSTFAPKVGSVDVG
jgi:hypothetical protein